MATPNAPTLLPLAESIADGSSIDWKVVEASASADDRAMIRQLRVLAELATVHRTIQVPATAPRPATAARSSTPASHRWARLDLIERIGGGASGEVYRAWDPQLEREVALKLLRADEVVANPQTSRILTEGRLLARVQHPNVVTVYGVTVHDGRLGLWMELVHGATLEDVLAKQGAFSAREATLIGIDLCRALAAIHKARLVHRDVKAQNVLREEGGRIVLMDLGTGREIVPAEPEPLNDLAGTPLYLAPELFEGEPASERTDLFSLGVLLYHLVTRSFPVRAATLDELRAAHARRERTRLRDARPDLPPTFVRVVDCATATDPADRYASAGALEADLVKSLDDSAGVRTASRDAGARTWYQSWGAGVAIAAALVMAVLLSRWGVQRFRGANLDPRSIRSIAVLPLVNLSGNASEDYFADGMTDELIGTLGRASGINVISRTSAMRFKGSKEPLPAIARALRVDAVLEGSILVVSAGQDAAGSKRVRINARLIQAGSDTQVWDRTFEAVVEDVVALQYQVAKAVADGIGMRLRSVDNGPPPNARAPQRNDNFELFTLYLKGRYYWNLRTEDGLQQSVQYFQDVIRRDPAYARAYAGLADAYDLLGVYGFLARQEAATLAAAAATRAVELDGSLAEAHTSLAAYHEQRFEWVRAESEYQQALALSPAYATAHHWYAAFLAQRARVPQALAEIDRALTLDPLSISISAERGAILLLGRRYDDAIAQLGKTLLLNPSYASAHVTLADAYTHKGEYERAVAQANEAATPGGSSPEVAAVLGFAYAAAGRRADALGIIDELTARYRRGEDESAGAVASIYAALNDADQAFVWLERSMSRRETWAAYLAVDPKFDNLHADPRYTKLVATLGVTQ